MDTKIHMRSSYDIKLNDEHIDVMMFEHDGNGTATLESLQVLYFRQGDILDIKLCDEYMEGNGEVRLVVDHSDPPKFVLNASVDEVLTFTYKLNVRW